MVWTALEVIGTIAFATSGALVGIQKKLDMFGIAMLSVVTAVGGGIIRDTLVGNTPPMAFKDPKFIMISLITTVVVCIAAPQVERFKTTLLICDALGLGAFTATAASIGLEKLDTLLLAAALAVTTGIGGGVIRDVFVQEIPFVFQKEIYAVASIIGAATFYVAQMYSPHPVAMYLCFIVTTTIRLVCLRYDIHLPTVQQNYRECE